MNIKPLNYNFTHKHRYKSDCEYANPANQRKSADLCGEKRDNITFSGSQDKSVAAANSFMGKTLKSGVFNWLTKFSGGHNIASSALIALFLAGLLRPAATVALPGKKDKDDKIYAAGHSMASAIVGFVFSTIITSPLDSGSKFIIEDARKMSKADFAKLSEAEIRKILEEEHGMSAEDIQKCLDEKKAESVIAITFAQGLTILTEKTDKINDTSRHLKSTNHAPATQALGDQIRSLDKHIKAIDTTMHNVAEWAIAVPRAALTIALIPLILKYVFHLEKKKPAAPNPQQENNQTKQDVPEQPKTDTNNNLTLSGFMTKSMKDFSGGQK